MNSKKTKLYHFIAPDDPKVGMYANMIDSFMLSDNKYFSLNISPRQINDGHVGIAQEILLALQHYPYHIRHMLFTMDFKFTTLPGSVAFLQDNEWKADMKYAVWYKQLYSLPFSIFFVQDMDARFRILAGDLYAAGKLPAIKKSADGSSFKIDIKGEFLHELCNRLIVSSYLLLIYCHNSGFNPKAEIESVLLEFGLPVRYSEVYKHYLKALNDKVSFTIKPHYDSDSKAA